MTNFWRDKNNKVNSFQVLKYFKFLALYTDLADIPRVNDKILNKISKKIEVFLLNSGSDIE